MTGSRLNKLVVVSPSRTSTGGSAFANALVVKLEEQVRCPVEHVHISAFGKLSISSHAVPALVLFLGSRAVRVAGSRAIYWPLNVAPLERHVARIKHANLLHRPRQYALRFRLKNAVDAADALIFGSNHARSLYMASFPNASTKPYAVVNCGTRSLGTLTNKSTALERSIVDPNSERLILVVSHLYPYKGILEFVEAIGTVRDKLDDDIRIRIAGNPADRRYSRAVQRRIVELGITKYFVISPANQKELALLYAAASLVVFPSTCENAASFALYDGLHAGCPTVCSDRSSMPEMVKDAVMLANPYNAKEFGSAIIHLLSTPSRRVELSNRALAWSSDAPSWSSCAAQLADFLSGVSDEPET